MLKWSGFPLPPTSNGQRNKERNETQLILQISTNISLSVHNFNQREGKDCIDTLSTHSPSPTPNPLMLPTIFFFFWFIKFEPVIQNFGKF